MMLGRILSPKRTLVWLLLAAVLLIGMQACAVATPATEEANGIAEGEEGEVEGYGESALSLPLGIVNITLIIIVLVIIAISMVNYGNSTVGGAWGYFLIATALLGATRLFYLLADRGVIFVADETLAVGWHLIFYVSMLAYYLGGRGLVRMVTMDEAWTSLSEVFAWGLFALLFTVAVFVGAEFVDKPIVEAYGRTFMARIGLHHWIAFALGSLVTLYVLRVRLQLGPSISVIANPLLIALALMALYHLWELLTESLYVIVLPERTIDRAEQLITTPIALAIIYGFYRSRVAMFGRGPARQATQRAQPGQG